MTPRRRLAALRQAASRRLRALREVVDGILHGDPIRSTEIRVSYATLEALNTWRNFVRAYYLSYAVDAKSENGATLTFEHPLTMPQALAIAVHSGRPTAVRRADGTWDRRDEPAWHDPNTLLTLCRNLGASNLPHVEAALSSQSRVFSDLPVFRNYFAHRNQQTKRAAVALAPLNSVPASPRPTGVLLAIPAQRYQSLLLEWLDDLALTIEYLCF